MNHLNRFLRGVIVLCGLAAGILATVYNPTQAVAQGTKCYYCVCEVACVCVEVKCQDTVEPPH